MSQLGAKPAAGVADVVAGTTLIDFSDPRLWIPYGHASADPLTYTAGGLNVKTSGARAAATKIFAGVKARFRLFPNAAGLLSFKFIMANYTHPVDDAAADLGVLGLGFLSMGGSLEIIGAGVYLPPSDPRLIRGTFLSAYNAFLSAPNYQDIGLPEPSTLEFWVTIGPGAAFGNADYLTGTAGPPITICKVSKDGGGFVDFSTAPNGPWVWNWLLSQGVSFNLGLWTATRNQNLGCRFTSFQLVSGAGVIG